MPEYQSDPITQRLDRLERENWYWKRATLLLLIVIASAILMGQTGKPSRIEAEMIEAQSIVLKDSNGKKRGELGKNDRGHYGLYIYSAVGKDLASLVDDTASKEVRLEMNANNSLSSATLGVSDDIAGLHLIGIEQTKEVWDRRFNEFSKQLKAAKTIQEMERVFSDYPSHGVEASITASPKRSSVELSSGWTALSGNGIAMHLSEDRQPTLELSDEKHIKRAVLGYTKLGRTKTGIVEQRPPSSLVLMDKNGGVIWQAP
jgi:hypothetical protein